MKTYMTTFKERLSYWTYFVGQNVYYNIKIGRAHV